MSDLESFKPCNGCGYCCISAACYRSVVMGWDMNKDKLCERLFFDKGRYWCQEIIDNPEAMETVGVGFGCPSTLYNTWRDNVKRRT